MKVFLGRQEMDFKKLMLVGISLILILLSEYRVDAVCNLPNFQCQNGSSVSGCLQCDHRYDCPDKSDETGCAQVDYSMALLWSSKDSPSGLGTLGLLYGDLDVCLEQLRRGQTFNVSYYRRAFRESDFTDSFDSMEVDYVADNIIYFNQVRKGIDIGRQIITGNHWIYRLSLPPVSNQVSGLSFDWSSKLVYLSDAGYQHIAVFYRPTSDDSYIWWRPVVDTDLTSPQDVVVYPNQSYIFWIDLGISSKIERFDLVNDIRKVLVSNGTIQRPTKLAIDFTSDRLYWLDSNKQTIGSCNLDGLDVSLWQLSLFSTISAFTFYRQYLFLGDRTSGLVYAFNASRYQVLSNFEIYPSQQGIIDFATYDPSKQMTITSPCTVANGGCSHFCIRINAKARKCQCAMGFFLDSDGTSCVTRPFQDKFLLVSDTLQQQLYQVDIATGEVRATILVDKFSPTAADYDYFSNSFFWFDRYNRTIRESNLNSGTTRVFLDYTATEITSLAVDAVEGNVYYTSNFTGIIGVISLSTAKSRTILSNTDSAPGVIVLDSDSRSLFWSDCGQRSIEKAPISNASDHQSIVSQLDFCVSALAIDFINEVMYWGDQAGRIKSSRLDGSERRLVYNNSAAIYTGMAIDDSYLYIADKTLSQILKLDRVTHQISSLTGNVFSQPYALVRYDSSSGSSKTSTSTTAASTSGPQGGVSKTTTIIVAVVICGSVILIVVVVGLLVAIWIKRRKSGVKSDGYDNVIPQHASQSNGDSQHEVYAELDAMSDGYDTNSSQSNNERQDETYTELDDLPNPTYDFEIENMGNYDELKETTESNRRSGIDNDYI